MKNHPKINFVYSVQSVCVNLRTTQRIADYECEHIEADTMIFYIYSQIRQSGINDLVVIDAEDPDVVVLSAYVAHMINGPLAIKRKQSIINCRTLCPNDIAKILIPLHVHSGCDTTCAFFGRGKKNSL